MQAELQDRTTAPGDAQAEGRSGEGGSVWECVEMMQQERGCSTVAGPVWLNPMLFYFSQVQPKRSHSSAVLHMLSSCSRTSRISPLLSISHASLHHTHPYLNLFVHYTPKMKCSWQSCRFLFSWPSIFHCLFISHESRDPPSYKNIFFFAFEWVIFIFTVVYCTFVQNRQGNSRLMCLKQLRLSPGVRFALQELVPRRQYTTCLYQ